jgi:hypothetical protein
VVKVSTVTQLSIEQARKEYRWHISSMPLIDTEEFYDWISTKSPEALDWLEKYNLLRLWMNHKCTRGIERSLSLPDATEGKGLE